MVFGALGTENIDFLVLRGHKHFFLVPWGQKILIFGALEAPTKGGDPSTCQNPPESFEKTMVLGGEALGADGEARNPGPPKSIKIKENYETQKPKAQRQVTRTTLHARRASAVADEQVARGHRLFALENSKGPV